MLKWEHVSKKLGPQDPGWAARENGKETRLVGVNMLFCSVSNSLSRTTLSIKWEVYFSKRLCHSSLLCVVVFYVQMYIYYVAIQHFRVCTCVKAFEHSSVFLRRRVVCACIYIFKFVCIKLCRCVWVYAYVWVYVSDFVCWYQNIHLNLNVCMWLRESQRGVMSKMQDSSLKVSEFELQSRYLFTYGLIRENYSTSLSLQLLVK